MEAEAQLGTIRQRFLEKRLPYEFAVVSLDLGRLHLEARRWRQVAEAVLEVVPVFEGLGIEREALGALLMLALAAKREKAARVLLDSAYQLLQGTELKARKQQPRQPG